MDPLERAALRGERTSFAVGDRHSQIPQPSNSPSPEALGYLRMLTGDATAEFRDDQWDVIDGLVNRREKVLLVQRTGWGKSAVYFISAKLLRDRGRGPTLIVSPLLSLMRNQVMAGRRMGLWIGAFHSGTQADFSTFQNLVSSKKLDVLLTTPEQFANARFLDGLLPSMAQNLGLLVVDEAHCISDWGHDFRPDYQRISNIIGKLPVNTALLATSATANQRVVTDIRRQLGRIRVSKGPLDRQNLALQATDVMSPAARLAWLAANLPTLDGQGIVYTLKTEDADMVSSWLTYHGISAAAYHGQISATAQVTGSPSRSDIEDQFDLGNIRVLVATNALGLGYDNPNVRFVIHYGSPSSLIAYYQQVGRAGRNLDSALGILMSGPEDEDIHRFFRTSSLPNGDEIANILVELEKRDQATCVQLGTALNVSPKRIGDVLGFLAVQQPATVVSIGNTWHRNPVPFPQDYSSLRSRLMDLRKREWREMQEYRRNAGECRMKTILRALDDPTDRRDCGRCDHCIGENLLPIVVDRTLMDVATTYLDSPSGITLSPKRQIPRGDLQANAKSEFLSRKEVTCEGRALLRWGQSGMGSAVSHGKREGSFADPLVEAAVAMIRRVWKPTPFPAWVTGVPSLRNADLVENLARRIAEKLEIEYVPVVVKVSETGQQKLQQNEFHQYHNLDGAFAIKGQVPSGPVLLVDDVVDSGWTFAVIGMLLRRAGSGPVLPFALALSKSRYA